MNIRELLNDWASHSYDPEESAQVCVNLPLAQVAHILALTDMFPGRSKEQVITDLLKVMLNDLEEAFPYVKGDKIIAEDEFGDPIYEDKGLTPRFIELSRKHLEQLQSSRK